MKIEVEWKSIASGITTIDITDLCKNGKEWDELSKKEQEKRINQWLLDNEYKAYRDLSWEKI